MRGNVISSGILKAESVPVITWWRSPTALAIIASNLVPVFGVLFLGWDLFSIMFLYWAENVIIGLFNLARLLLASPNVPAMWIAKIFLIPFFCVHYGMFCLVHGIFVIALFGGGMKPMGGFPNPAHFIGIISERQLWFGVAAIFVSHGFAFLRNYVLKGEYQTAGVDKLMARPYGRIVLLHVTLLLGAFLTMALHAPTAALVLLVGLKIFLDVRVYLRERAGLPIVGSLRTPSASPTLD